MARKTTTEDRKARVNDLVRQMADEFIAALEEGIANPANWQAPWHQVGGIFPTNAKTGKRYNGTNAWWLALKGRGGSYWATYRQWSDLGGQVKKGEKGTTILVPKTIKITEEKDGEEVEKRITVFGTATVFHVSQQEGWEPPALPAPAKGDEPAPAFDAWQRRVIAKSGISFTQSHDTRAYYSPSADMVHLPWDDYFKSAEGRRATFAHEFAHATGHGSRLDRAGITSGSGFGSAVYAQEELVAELTAATLGVALGIATELRDDHRDYLAGWIKALKDEPKALMEAAKDAERAAEWLLEFAEDAEVAA